MYVTFLALAVVAVIASEKDAIKTLLLFAIAVKPEATK